MSRADTITVIEEVTTTETITEMVEQEVTTTQTITETVDQEVEVEVTSEVQVEQVTPCLLYTSPSPRDKRQSRMPSSA